MFRSMIFYRSDVNNIDIEPNHSRIGSHNVRDPASIISHYRFSRASGSCFCTVGEDNEDLDLSTDFFINDEKLMVTGGYSGGTPIYDSMSPFSLESDNANGEVLQTWVFISSVMMSEFLYPTDGGPL